jgi:hypothetical protein
VKRPDFIISDSAEKLFFTAKTAKTAKKIQKRFHIPDLWLGFH